MAEAFELLWWDDACGAALRRRATQRGRPPASAVEARTQDLVEEAIRAATPASGPHLADTIAAAIRVDGKFIAPLVTLRGVIEAQLDPLEQLRALVTATLPFLSPSARERAVWTDASSLLEIPGLRGASAGVDDMLRRVRAALAQDRDGASTTEDQTSRGLLEGRHLAETTWEGAPRALAGVRRASGEAVATALLPPAAIACLPLVRAFQACVIATAHPAPRSLEGAPAAVLDVKAIARVLGR